MFRFISHHTLAFATIVFLLLSNLIRVDARPPEWQQYHRAFHTSTSELAHIALRAKPKKLVLSHQLFWGASDDDLVREIRGAGYSGTVISGKDLDVFEVGK